MRGLQPGIELLTSPIIMIAKAEVEFGKRPATAHPLTIRQKRKQLCGYTTNLAVVLASGGRVTQCVLRGVVHWTLTLFVSRHLSS